MKPFFVFNVEKTINSLMKKLLFEKNTISFSVDNMPVFKRKAFAWATQFEVVSHLDNNQYANEKYSGFENLLAVGAEEQILTSKNFMTEGKAFSPAGGGRGVDSFDLLKNFHNEKKDWLFGFLTYDLKNETEDLSSKHFDGIELPDLHFFQPKIVIEFLKNEIKIHSKNKNAASVFKEINQTPSISKKEFSKKKIKKGDIKNRISKKEYLKTLAKIKSHISKGDIYEMNFCQEFYIEDIDLDPYVLFEKFNTVGKAPFAAFYKFKNKYLLCASPERFLKKRDNTLLTQPIKGTIKRGTTPQKDEQLKQQLYNSPKDRSENVMIVDLVRNDLARSCKAGSVKVEELFGIYPFEQVHQMISTVVGELKDDIHFIDAIKNAYPMGSMTGAPKIRAMQLIEEFEKTKRGLYSGAVGYIKPNGDFDFNVVIRSMIYNKERKYLSYQTGGAIVFDSSPEGEYEECLLKAKGMMQTFENIRTFEHPNKEV